MICASWPSLRMQFALNKGSGAVNLQYVQGTPDTVVRTVGSFIADGVLTGHSWDVWGAGVTNAGRWPVASVAAFTLTLATDNQLVNQAAIASTFFSCYRDNDGSPSWPVSAVRMTGSGFGDAGSTLTGIPTPYLGASFEVTCNAGANDAVLGVDEYDWYLSQSTDIPASKYLSIVQKPAVGLLSYSGSVQIVHTALAVSQLGLTIPPSQEVRHTLFRFADLYVRQRTDGAIQWVNLLQRMDANVG